MVKGVPSSCYCPHCKKRTLMRSPKEIIKEKYTMLIGTCDECGNRSFKIGEIAKNDKS